MNIEELELQGVYYLESDEYKKKKKINDDQEKIRKYFVEKRFTPDFVRVMSIDDYVEGKNATYRDSFCYILEFKLDQIGTIRSSFIKAKFVIHYSEEEKKYLFQAGKFGKDAYSIFNNVRQEIVNVIDDGARDDMDALSNNKLSPMFKGKIYYVYYPEKSLPIYSERHIDFFLHALDIESDTKKENIFIKKKKLLDWKEKSPVFNNSNYSNVEFMNFLYSSYGFGKEVEILKNKDDISFIEPEIITDKDIIDRTIRKSTVSHRQPNFDEINRKKTAIGMSAEEYVLQYEMNHNPKYKRKIKQVGKDPTYGYDIVSFDDEGNEKHIEVKTCISGNLDKVDFYITANERKHLEEDEKYLIYYVCGIKSSKRKIIILTKDNLAAVTFSPIAYKITGKIDIK